ncbi:MAG: Eco29kI family restriction endonuclease [Sulfuritalea sp.]|nr:Eco29kI family restriction endonuclease [Sulfuritalea sp.]
MSAQIIPFNPLDKTNLGSSVADALLARPPVPLEDLREFQGAGVYAIYYGGKFKAYSALSARNQAGQFSMPIYVGKAVPAGSRRGGALDAKPGRVLHRRLVEHAESIRATNNLVIKDFHCRFLVVDDIWIPLGESLLIARFSPLWNSLVDGFGNHDPGSGRHAGMRPRWDVLHPGRAWAPKCRERKETIREIERDVVSFLNNILE